MADYLPILLLFGLTLLFVLGSFIGSALLSPKRQESSAKIGPYECGIVPEKEPAQRFPVKFYLVAMIFIIFDIEIIFLYPWAVLSRQLGVFGLVEMALFSVAVVVSFTYLISNGALDWGPISRLRDLEGEIEARLERAPARSTNDTIRRIPGIPKEAA